MRRCSVQIRIYGDPVLHQKPSCASNTYILPIFLYSAETWLVTATLQRTIDALYNWCLRRILDVHWSEFVTMMRYAPTLGSRSYQTLSVVTIFLCTYSLCRPQAGSSPSSPGLHHAPPPENSGPEPWRLTCNQ